MDVPTRYPDLSKLYRAQNSSKVTVNVPHEGSCAWMLSSEALQRGVRSQVNVALSL